MTNFQDTMMPKIEDHVSLNLMVNRNVIHDSQHIIPELRQTFAGTSFEIESDVMNLYEKSLANSIKEDLEASFNYFNFNVQSALKMHRNDIFKELRRIQTESLAANITPFHKYFLMVAYDCQTSMTYLVFIVAEPKFE